MKFIIGLAGLFTATWILTIVVVEWRKSRRRKWGDNYE